MINQILFNRTSHFHLMVKIRQAGKLKIFFKEKYPDRDPQSFGNFADLISIQFKNFFISYAKSFNKKYDRRGSLFLDNINRKLVLDEVYYTQLIYYIHHNPVHHGFVKHPDDWPFSSYSIMLSQKSTQLERAEILTWFGAKKDFLKFHQQDQEINRNDFY